MITKFGRASRVIRPLIWKEIYRSGLRLLPMFGFVSAALGLLVCTTPSYSPESNGMAEAFVKRFKADYVYLAELASADAALKQLPLWIEDYNEMHPHRGLKMLSPREYRRLNSTPLACPV